MNGSTISIIVFTVSIALFVFVVAFILSSLISKDKIASDKRLDDLKKSEGEGENIALVKHESRRQKLKKESRKQGGFFEKFGTALYKELQAADIKMRPEEFLTLWLLVAVLPASLVILFNGNPTIAIILLILFATVPMLIIRAKQKNRVKKFENQLSDALMIACSCLKSGLSFTQAMETISRDMDDPISGEFMLVIREMGMGATMEEALEKMNSRVKSSYVSLMVSAVLVQRQTGGNLSQILETISNSIKEKNKLKKELKSATASGKMSGMVVGLMPIIILALFFLVNREFVMPLFTTTIGKIFLSVAAGLEVLCFLIIKKITNVKM